MRTRFAPSPTGAPHVGNLRTAIFCWLLAKQSGGQFIARLEDTDRTRLVPESVSDIEASLKFLGITPDESWFTGGKHGPYVQSQNLDEYKRLAESLVEKGDAYYCDCKKDEATTASFGYNKACRDTNKTSGIIRLKMPLSGYITVRDEIRGDIKVSNNTQDDQVLIKSDGFPTYFMACAVDDHRMKVSHILRGDDWLSSASKLVHLINCLGYTAPKFVHLPLIMGIDKKKLSKRHGATTFSHFIHEGYLPEALMNFLALLGWSCDNKEMFTVSELVEKFSIKGISTSPAIFDYNKLKWMNGQYIRASLPERIVGLCLPYVGYDNVEYKRRVVPLVIDKLKVLSDVKDLTSFFWEDISYPEELKAKHWTNPEILQVVQISLPGEWNIESIESSLRGTQYKFADVVHATRLAITGRTIGPSIFETVYVMGRDRVMKRLKDAYREAGK